MAYGLVLKFDGVGSDQYWRVNSELGINPDGTGDVPPGLESHAAFATADGGFVVVEEWTSRADQEAFMGGRLGAALASIGLPPPTFVLDGDLTNSMHPHA